MSFANNAAGRILAVLDRLEHKHYHLPRSKFAAALSVTDDWDAILTAYRDLKDEFLLLVMDVDQFKDNPTKHKLYSDHLEDIRASLVSFTFYIPADKVESKVSPSSIVALKFIAADLPQEEPAAKEDLIRILESVTLLQRELESIHGLPRVLRDWLLHLLRVMRDSLDRYAIRGARGMYQQLATVLGELTIEFTVTRQFHDQVPKPFLARLLETLDVMHKVGTVVTTVSNAISAVHKALPLAQLIGLPMPPAGPNGES